MAAWFSRYLESLLPLLSALFLAYVAYWAESRRFRLRKILDLYAEFVGLSASELNRARMADAALICKPPSKNDKEALKAWSDVWAKRERERHELRRRLFRVAARVRLLESKKALRDDVNWLSEQGPFFWPDPSVEDYRAQETAIKAYAAKLDALTDAVRARYARR